MISASAVPDHLRGYMGRFLQQVGTGLYIGKLSDKTANRLCERLVEAAGTGAVVMICSDHGDTGFAIRTHQVTGSVLVDFDGAQLPVECRSLT